MSFRQKLINELKKNISNSDLERSLLDIVGSGKTNNLTEKLQVLKMFITTNYLQYSEQMICSSLFGKNFTEENLKRVKDIFSNFQEKGYLEKVVALKNQTFYKLT